MNKDTNIGYWEQVLNAPTPAYKELFEAEEKTLLENIKPDMKVLDIGCGDGRNMRTILRNTRFVTGIDNDGKAVKDLAAKIPEARVILAEASSLPFENESFDVVSLLMILPNLDSNRPRALSEAARVLKKNGFIILSSFAETAFNERLAIYKKVNAPIERIEGTKVIFNKSLGSNISEQFSLNEITSFASAAGLKIRKSSKVADLAYICILVRE